MHKLKYIKILYEILGLCCIFTQHALKNFAQKIKIEVKMCAHDEAVLWESFQKGKLANKL